MPNPKMLILMGNWAPAGKYPDEKGNVNVAWPIGALHVQAASDYAAHEGGMHPSFSISPAAAKPAQSASDGDHKGVS
jgi:hypothetical protein